ncbi:MAG: LamG domain-containing protein, partial [Leifsonia sp.]
AYATAVLADSPADYWRLGETSGPAVADSAGGAGAVANAGVTFGAAGAVGTPNTAATFNGTNGLVATQTTEPGRSTFAVEAWFATTSTTGGKVVGFGNANAADSTTHDRHLYLDGSGTVFFGVYPGARRTVQSGAGLNNGQWHHVVGNLGPTGMQLYVDGVLVAQRADTTTAQNYAGYWRIGGDTTWAGSKYLAGSIDEVAIYPAPLSAARVSAHYAASGR